MNGNAKVQAARLSILSNATLVFLKLLVGAVSHSISIIAEAIHSGVDLIAAMIAFYAVRISAQPPDEAHAYGHGKYENISGTVEALLIIVAAFVIGIESVKKLYHPVVLKAGLGVIVMLISALANLLVSANLFKVAKATDSIALEADGHHLRLDVFTSLGICLGLLAVYLAKGACPAVMYIDPVLGLLVAFWVGWIGLQLSHKAIGPLLDMQLPLSEVERITEIIHSDERVVGFHKLRTRKSGAQRHVDVHLIVPGKMSLSDAHELAEEIEDKIRAEFDHVSVLTHVEPDDDVRLPKV
jgi:cation diffusion facilitator family transporter